jgi:lipoprotein-releasing system permease protein
MSFSLAFGIAWRYTTGRKKRGMLSFLSSISMAGLVLGIALLILVMSVMNGFEKELEDRILSLVPHAVVYEAGGLQDWQALRMAVIDAGEVVEASPLIQLNGLVNRRKQASAALIYGIDIERERAISRLDDFLSQENIRNFEEKPNALILGAAIAEKLQLEVGDELSVVVPGRSASSRAPKIAFFELVGILETSTELDQTLVLISLDSARQLSKLPPGAVDGLRLKYDNLFEAPTRSYQLVRALGPTFYSTNWRRVHGNLYHSIKMSKNMVALLVSLIIALAAFNVISTLILVVVEKESSIAILRTLGASSGTILRVFICQGLLIGLGGIVVGHLRHIALEHRPQLQSSIFAVHFARLQQWANSLQDGSRE